MFVVSACHAQVRPEVAPADELTIEGLGPGRGIAGDGMSVWQTAQRTPGKSVLVELPVHGTASAGAAAKWFTEIDGEAGPLAYASDQLITAIAGTGSAHGVTLRGQPGAVVAAFATRGGTPRWRLAVDSTEWVIVASIAATDAGIAIGGTFQGTLRIGSQTVSSAGRSEGFVARLAPDGTLAWLVRVGGDGADAVSGVAIAGDRVAIGGSVAGGAELLGVPIRVVDERSLLADAFVAELDRDGHRIWAKTFGGEADDHVAGVAIDARGNVVVAATARGEIKIDGAPHTARGAGDALVAWYTSTGEAGPAVMIGGSGFDGARSICAIGDRVIVGGFFTGTLQLGDRVLTATGDDAFLVALEPGKVVASWPIPGDGREDISAIAAIPGGFLAGVAHTNVLTAGARSLSTPVDPLQGFGIVQRAVR